MRWNSWLVLVPRKTLSKTLSKTAENRQSFRQRQPTKWSKFDVMPAKVLQIAAAQFKFRRTVPENVELIRRIIAEAARAGSDVVLFPECALTGYNVDFHRFTR